MNQTDTTMRTTTLRATLIENIKQRAAQVSAAADEDFARFSTHALTELDYQLESAHDALDRAEMVAAHAAGEHVTSWEGCPTCEQGG